MLKMAHTKKAHLYMSKRIIFSVLFLTVFLYFPMPSFGGKLLQETRVPDTLSSGLFHLLTLADPDNKVSFNLRQIENVLDFIASSKNASTLYYADKKFGAPSAYYEFDIHDDLSHILNLAYNPEIPSFALTPSSVRLSYWSEIEGREQPLPRLWNLLPELDCPVIVRGVQHVENTPDLFTGAYFGYDLDRTLILCKYKGRNILISLSKQRDISDVGRKGLVLGSDDDWNYLYSDQRGLTKPGLGWVHSYMYDSYAISVFYEIDSDTPLVRYGIFKWIRAGWLDLNMVKKKHIHKGLVRFAKSFKKIIEYPYLPKAEELAGTFLHIQHLSLEELRDKTRDCLKILETRCGKDNALFRKWFSKIFKSDGYLYQMTRKEMQSVLILEYMKYILGKN